METLEAIETRRSIRKYLDIPVEAEKLGYVLNAGRLAPSAGNLQDWKFIVITEHETRHKIADICMQQDWMADAPLHIAVCSEPGKEERAYGKRGEETYSIQNAAAATTQMILAAHDQGLGSCWVSAFDDAKLRKLLEIPDAVRPLVVITLGYPDESPKAPSKLTLANVTFVNSWGNKVKDLATYMGYYSEHVAKMAQKGKEFWKKFVENLQK